MSPYAHITGWGMAVPDRILTNFDLEQIVDTSDEWIVSRTGIHQRRIATTSETTSSLATQAALNALEVAGVSPADVELIIVATSSPEFIFPATASIVQDQLGALKAGAFDILAACSGFIFSLDIATQSIRTGSIKTAVVIGAETLSRLIDWSDRNTCVLFGDGAGAFVLQAREERAGQLSSVIRSDGSGGDLLSIPGGGSRFPTSIDTINSGLHFIQMNGREVFRFATRVMSQATEEAVKKIDLTIDDINMIVPHQANRRIIENAIRNLNLPPERCFINIEQYGNTSTASIPIATCEAVEQSKIQPGDNVVFVGFGAGLTWGASVVKWSGPVSRVRVVRPVVVRLYARLRSILRRIMRKIDAIIIGRDSTIN